MIHHLLAPGTIKKKCIHGERFITARGKMLIDMSRMISANTEVWFKTVTAVLLILLNVEITEIESFQTQGTEKVSKYC